MASVEWNKKEELVAEQALKHLKVSLNVTRDNFTDSHRSTHQCSRLSVKEEHLS